MLELDVQASCDAVEIEQWWHQDKRDRTQHPGSFDDRPTVAPQQSEKVL